MIRIHLDHRWIAHRPATSADNGETTESYVFRLPLLSDVYSMPSELLKRKQIMNSRLGIFYSFNFHFLSFDILYIDNDNLIKFKFHLLKVLSLKYVPVKSLAVLKTNLKLSIVNHLKVVRYKWCIFWKN